MSEIYCGLDERRKKKEMLWCLKKWMQYFWRHFECDCESECEYLEVDSGETKTSIYSLPDDVIINILTRLPTQTVLECKLVVSQWNHLSSTPFFAQTHLTGVTPLLMFEDRHFNQVNYKKPMFLLLQGCGKNARFKRVRLKYLQLMHDYPFFRLLCSCNGILIFVRPVMFMYVIYNPITLENIIYKEKGHKVFGFFFHELEKDYKMMLYEMEDWKGKCYYYLYSLRNKDKRSLGSSSYMPLLSSGSLFENELAVVVCGVVFWIVTRYFDKSELSKRCSESIVMFDLITEKFIIMPHPGSTCTRSFHIRMRLLDMDGRLCLCNVCENIIDIWILQDATKWIWEKMYVVKLDRHYIRRIENYWAHPIVAIHSGNLILNWPRRGIFLCNLANNYMWNIKAPYNYDRYKCPFYAIKYTSSFVSFERDNI